MFNKKILTLGSVVAMAAAGLSLASCGGSGSGKTITVWCPSDDNAVMATIISNFKASNSAYADYDIKVLANMGEGEVKDALLKDVGAAADVMCIADDNIRDAVKGEALTAIGSQEATALATTDGANGVSAGSIAGTAYGYPYRADNSYVLMYNNQVISSTQASTLEGLLLACKNANKKVYVPFQNSWYGASYLWANGCTQTLNADGSQLTVTFNNDAGVAAANAMSALYKTYGVSTMVWEDSNSTIEAGFQDGTVAACILWNDVNNLETAVGNADHITATKLPTIKIGSANKQLKAFLGYKHMVVKKNPHDLAAAQAFVQYATNKESQKLRLTELKYGPSNLELQASTEVQSLKFIKAIGEMNAADGTVPQASSVNGNFWSAMESFGNIIKNNAQTNSPWGDYDDAQAALDVMVAAMQKKVA